MYFVHVYIYIYIKNSKKIQDFQIFPKKKKRKIFKLKKVFGLGALSP